jgi:2-isopropylmalate synthase
MGLALTKPQLDEVVTRVKELGDKGRNVTETDLFHIFEAVTGSTAPEKRRIELGDLVVVTGSKTTPTATLRLLIDGKEYRASEFGVGPIDATLKAIENAAGDVASFKLVDFKLEAITGGSDALANVTVKITDSKGRVVSAKGVREDIVMAGVEAVVNAANRLLLINSLTEKGTEQG